MRSIVFFLGVFLTSLMACAQAEKNTDHPESEDWDSYGAEITSDEATPYAKLMSLLETSDSVTTKVRCNINSVCKVKGCWMNVSSDDSAETFVKFKDYGFFVPKDSEGREVIMEGVAYREVTSVEELRHYAEDAGKSKEEIAAITEPREELKFMASGVLLKK